MSRSPIHQELTEMGAQFVQMGDVEPADHFGDPGAEYSAAAERVGLADLSFRGKIVTRGADRAEFLHNMTSNEIKKLTPGQGCHTTLLTPKGKMVGDLVAYIREEEIRIDLERDSLSVVLETFDQFVVMEDIQIEDASDGLTLFGLYGPNSAELIGKVLGEPFALREPYSHVSREFNGEDVLVAKGCRKAGEAYFLYVDSKQGASFWKSLMTNGQEFGIQPVGYRVLEILRVEAGIPRYGVDMDDTVFPMEAGLDDAISYDKGCYIGQEVISRIDAMGHVNRHLRGFRLSSDTIPEHGAKLLSEGKEVGYLTSAVVSPRLGEVLALGYLHQSAEGPEAKVVAQVNGESVEAIRVELPLAST